TAPLAAFLTTGFDLLLEAQPARAPWGSRPARNSGRRGSGRCPEQRMPQLMPANGGYCAHQRYRVWHECLEPGRLPRHGAQPHLTPRWKCGYPLEHWADVRRDSSAIFRTVFGGLVKLAETGAPVGSPEEDPRTDRRADGPHGARDFYDWRDDGLFEKINFELLLQTREAAGREASPSAGVIDS